MTSQANKIDLFPSFLNVWWFYPGNMMLVFFIFGIGLACKKSQLSQSELVEAEFSVDTSLLENIPFTDSLINLQFKTPLNWTVLDPETILKLEAGMLTGDYQNAKLINALINKSDSSMLLLLDVSSIDNLVFKALKINYNKILNPNQRWSDIQLSEFKLNCFRLEQYLLQSKDMMHFKLVGYDNMDMQNKPKFELMYFIHPKNFEKDIKFVESSIGSLNCLTFKK